MIKLKLDLLELVRLASTVEQAYLLRYQGKTFTFFKVGEEIVIFYTDMKTEGSFVKYNPLEDKMECVNYFEKASDIVYIPLITVDKIEGLELWGCERVIALHFFFRNKKDALAFFMKFNTRLQYLFECENVYGHCYDVVLCKDLPKTSEKLWRLGEEEYNAASKMLSFIAHESSSSPVDVAGIKSILLMQKP